MLIAVAEINQNNFKKVSK